MPSPVIVLDAAGTLLALRRPVGETYSELAREAGIELDPVRIERTFHHAFQAAPPLAFGDRDPPSRRAAEQEWWRGIVRECMRAAGVQGSVPLERFFDLAWDRFAGPQPWRVPEDVRPGLRALRRRGLPLAILSNWDGRLPGLLDAVGLRGYFARVLISADLPAAKPSPVAFRSAADAIADLAPGRPVMVGDRLDHDVVPAITAGWTAVWLDRRNTGGPVPAGAATRVASLRELAGLALLDPA